VTISLWWVTTLLQPAGHAGLRLIEDLPELGGSATLADPAFEVQKRLAAMLPVTDIVKRILCRELCLYVSDLSEATDHVPHIIALELLKGLFQGSGLWERDPYWRIAVELLVTPRELVYPDETYIISSAGILMGDPLTRVGLYMLSICCIRMTRMMEGIVLLYGVTAGDDHLVVGSRAAGLALRDKFIEAGAEIQMDKTQQSYSLVKYCEKGIAVNRWTDLAANPFVKGDTGKYLVIDAIKTRLVSPESKSRDSEDEANPAIGRIPLLYKNLRWSIDIDERFLRIIPYIYMSRFPSGRLPSDFRMLAIPPQWGGLGAYIVAEDISRGFEALPKYMKAAIVKVVLGQAPSSMIRALGAVTKKCAFRGLLKSGIEECPNEVEGLFWHFEPKQIKAIAADDQAGNVVPSLGIKPFFGLKKIETVLKSKGWLLRSELPSLMTRAQFFDLVLSGTICSPSWKERKWRFRYQDAKKALVNVWNEHKMVAPTAEEYSDAIGMFKYVIVDGVYLNDYAIPPMMTEIFVCYDPCFGRRSVGVRGPGCWRYAPLVDPDCAFSLRSQICFGLPTLSNVLRKSFD
jgi:hypothetical protein